MTSEGRRVVLLETCQNFRDIGGYGTADGRRVAWGRLYRADTLHRLSPADLEALVRLDIRTVVDLRARNEVERHGRLTAHGHDITYHHMPMLDRVMGPDRPPEAPHDEVPTDLGAFYIRMLDEGRTAIAGALRIMSEPGATPAVFHCMAGKDRTGILAAVVLGCLGVPDEDIVHDYVLTEAQRAVRDAYLAEHDPEYLAYLDSLPPFARETRPETMWSFLNHVGDVSGSMSGYLEHTGVGSDVVAALRDALLEH